MHQFVLWRKPMCFYWNAPGQLKLKRKEDDLYLLLLADHTEENAHYKTQKSRIKRTLRRAGQAIFILPIFAVVGIWKLPFLNSKRSVTSVKWTATFLTQHTVFLNQLVHTQSHLVMIWVLSRTRKSTSQKSASSLSCCHSNMYSNN